MKKQPFRFTFSLLICLLIPLMATAQTVHIPDPNLRAAIVSSGNPTVADMESLDELMLTDANVSDLTGLEHAINLTFLDLSRNSISDISALAGLTQLAFLSIGENSISDISALAGSTQLIFLNLWGNSVSDISALRDLTQLTSLILGDNSISDISALTGLTQLTELSLTINSVSDISALTGLTQLTFLSIEDNSISDISALAGLTQLTFLNLWGNSISDISALTSLTQLTELSLWENSISDLSPLVENTGLGSGATLDVQANPLSYLSINTHIPTLQSRGVTVEFDNQAQPALLKISGDNQKGMSGVALSAPFVVEVQDENGPVSDRVQVTFAVTAGDGILSITRNTTDQNGRAESTLTLGSYLGTNTVSVSADGIENPVTFNATSDTGSPPITADVNRDGKVNILDIVSVASSLGNKGPNLAADVNGDGVVNILDLVTVAGMFEAAAAAPSAHPQISETLTAVEVQKWLTAAISIEVKDPITKKGIMVLGHLMAALTPTETELLPNYPNPFNPETWIPYRLAEDASVTLTICDQSGWVVRTLDVGHRVAAVYESRSKAVYWDGRNETGERVASGLYFYTLTAGDFSATRKMLIVK